MTNQTRVVALVGSALLALGSLLDWATVSTGFGEIGVAGTEGDGVITLIAGLLAGVLFLASKPKIAAAVAGLGTAVAVYDFSNVASHVAGASASVNASVGIGLYLCVIGGAAATIAGFMIKAVESPASTG